MVGARSTVESLGQRLDQLAREGELYERQPHGAVRCYACGHRCLVKRGLRGICKVRFNRDGRLLVPTGYVAGLQCDPTEKKPLYHVRPGSLALTFGMLGCDYHCPYCQNWVTSQALRDPTAGFHPQVLQARDLVSLADESGARLVVSSYNEPLITSEWAMDVFRLAKPRGFLTAYVSNGNATREALDYLRPWLDCYKVDLKSMSGRSYRKLGGVLSHVTETIRMAVGMGFWVEVVTLVVPGFNDSDDELREAARFLASVSPDIPWHVTAFHQDYRMHGPDNTSPRTVIRAAEIGMEEGLRYVYAGNLPGQVGPYEDTRCPTCGQTLVQRYGYTISQYRVTPHGTCPGCNTSIPGLWWPGEREAVSR